MGEIPSHPELRVELSPAAQKETLADIHETHLEVLKTHGLYDKALEVAQVDPNDCELVWPGVAISVGYYNQNTERRTFLNIFSKEVTMNEEGVYETEVRRMLQISCDGDAGKKLYNNFTHEESKVTDSLAAILEGFRESGALPNLSADLLTINDPEARNGISRTRK